MPRDLPIAWLQLTHSKSKFVVAVTGVVVSVLLMWMQLGFLDALYRSATSIARQVDVLAIHGSDVDPKTWRR